MRVLIILGTAREGRFSAKAADFVMKHAKAAGFEVELIDPRDYRIAATDNTETSPQAKKLSKKVTEADALIIVSPEYNHGYPGELKMMLDMLYDQYEKKPVGICGVSDGGFGGVRMVEQLRLVCIELRMVPVKSAVYFAKVKELFDEKGGIKDESYKAKTEKFLRELEWHARALKTARKAT